jgi:hypothetical protein
MAAGFSSGFWLDMSRDGDRKSLRSFDQGKPAGCGGVGDWLEGGKVNSVLQGRLARGMDDRGFAPDPSQGRDRLAHPPTPIEPLRHLGP